MDAILIEGIRRGDETAFSELYHQYHSKLYFYFQSKLHLSDVAADLVQTTFVKCWHYRHQLTTELALSHQVFRIAKTTLIDWVRQKARERLVYLEDYPQLIHISESPHSLHHGIDEVTATLDRLPPERRKIIQFRLSGMTNTEIAEQLGISKKTVENQLNRAIKEIRSIVDAASELSFALLLISLLQTEPVLQAVKACIN